MSVDVSRGEEGALAHDSIEIHVGALLATPTAYNGAME